jgi:aminoglycoside phosphotransferase family enzyme
MDQKMRAYTAWVVQNGKDPIAQYLDANGDWQTDVRRALQLARRTDARNIIESFSVGNAGKPVEKTFG